MTKKIQSLERAANILRLFTLSRPCIGISEISRELNLPKGTVQGLVQTLAEEGMLRKDIETRKYQLGYELYELGVILTGSLEINQKASEPANNLAKRVKHLISVAVRDGNSALITLDAYPRVEPFLSRHFGPRRPLYCTSIGKAILAFMPNSELENYLETTELVSYTINTITRRERLLSEIVETRQRGFAINKAEHTPIRAGVGAPIFDRRGYVIGSIAIVISPKQLSENEKKMALEVKETAAEISRYMGFFRESATRIIDDLTTKD